MTYLMPAEWEPQAATWLAWPHNKEDWPDKFEPIPWVYAEMIRYLTRTQRVRLVVKNDRQKAQAQDALERAGAKLKSVDFIIANTDRVWLRDSGATVVINNSPSPSRGEGRGEGENKKNSPHLNPLPKGARTLIDWRFNAWAKYPNWKYDDKMPEVMEAFLKLPRVQPVHKGKRVVLEGGSIDVNGKGTLITTEECLLSRKQCRNPGFTVEDYESVFGHYLGIDSIIWLDKGIVGDDTHGHVDDITRFVNPTTIVTAVEKDTSDKNHAILAENLKRLKKARDAKGKQFTIATLPMPRPVAFEGQRLPASYANFLIANGLVLVPVFNDPADRIALNVLAELFPKREVVPVYCGDFVWGLGTIHCASQQEPASFS